MSTLIKIVSKTMSNMAILETKIEQQNIEIMRLNHKVCALTAKVRTTPKDLLTREYIKKAYQA